MSKPKCQPAAAKVTRTNADDLRQHLSQRLSAVRSMSLKLAAPLSAEDQQIQTMPDVSPTKWHLAHTTWFFETFVLCPHATGYEVFNDEFDYLFNSYYHTKGKMHPRPQRGLISRPSVDEVIAFRRHADAALTDYLSTAPTDKFLEIAPVIEIGINHEQQHQELMMTDIKHVLSVNPFAPAAYGPAAERPPQEIDEIAYFDYEGGLVEIGYGGDGFCFDNETPRHKVFIEPFRLAGRPVTNAEFRRFMEDGGYERVDLWLSDGWAAVQERKWAMPFYWSTGEDGFHEFTMAGRRPLDPAKPVTHLSYYEADAYARWAGKRLPTEAELEVAAAELPVEGNFLSADGDVVIAPEPRPAPKSDALRQVYGDVWEWTQSPYSPYPGHKPLAGSLGEYNRKFMCNQMVLRGGSSATPQGHVRASYRNFFPPDAQWQFSGVRLADSD